MSARTPVIRHFIACEAVEETKGPTGRQYSLHGLIAWIRPLPGFDFPRIHPALSLYVMLAEGQGLHDFGVEVVYWSRGDEISLWRTKTLPLDLGSDPLIVHGWPIRLRNLLLPQAGDCDFILRCDGNELARETIHVGEAL